MIFGCSTAWVLIDGVPLPKDPKLSYAAHSHSMFRHPFAEAEGAIRHGASNTLPIDQREGSASNAALSYNIFFEGGDGDQFTDRGAIESRLFAGWRRND